MMIAIFSLFFNLFVLRQCGFHVNSINNQFSSYNVLFFYYISVLHYLLILCIIRDQIHYKIAQISFGIKSTNVLKITYKNT